MEEICPKCKKSKHMCKSMGGERNLSTHNQSSNNVNNTQN